MYQLAVRHPKQVKALWALADSDLAAGVVFIHQTYLSIVQQNLAYRKKYAPVGSPRSNHEKVAQGLLPSLDSSAE
jgi:hypothetical protein